jgi:D-glycero-D-manno-heptose 1,7-bisphosphate phosphatase
MRLLLLDRDGVINFERDDYVKSPEEWQAIPGSLEAIARATRAGVRMAVITNQSGLARGLFDVATLHAIHSRMLTSIQEAGGQIEAIFFCPHAPEEGCECRKPAPGLLQLASERLNKSLEDVPFIGDALTDLEAARRAGAKPVLVRTGKGERTLATGVGLELVPVFRDLAEAIDDLLDDA